MSLQFHVSSPSDFPACCLQRGPFLVVDNQQLLQGGMGFGVPVLKRKELTFFPDSANVETLSQGFATITFRMNRVLKLKGPLTFMGGSLTKLAALVDVGYGRVEIMRRSRSLRVGKIIRDVLRMKWAFEEVRNGEEITVTYELKDDSLSIEADFSALREEYSEFCLLNEQGAGYFGHYVDYSGLELTDREIGGWERVLADQAFLFCDQPEVGFGLKNKSGAALYRGRELFVAGQELFVDVLNWAGLDYQFLPRAAFSYEIELTGAGRDRCRIALPIF